MMPAQQSTNQGSPCSSRGDTLPSLGGAVTVLEPMTDYVFEFGEHYLPARTMFATVQGLRGHKATMGMLWETKSTNVTPDEVNLATEGHLLRFMKQLGMRGRARKF